MSVEKFNPKVKGESIPYLQANRHVVQNITNTDSLAVWIYLLSLPADWNIIKEHVQKHFHIGQDKLKKIFAYLKRVNLIDYVKERRADGTLGTTEIIVLNGSKFNDGTADLSTENTTGVKTTPLENHTCGSELLHIKQNTYEILNKKSFCEKDEKAESKTVDNSRTTEKPYSGKKKDWKEANQTKHSWADGKKDSPVADVTRQSTSYDPSKHNDTKCFDPDAPGYQAFLNANPAIKRAHERRKKKQATELSTGTPVQPEISSREHASEKSSEHALDGQSYFAPELRNSHRVMAPSSARSYLEKTGLASEDRVNGNARH